MYFPLHAGDYTDALSRIGSARYDLFHALLERFSKTVGLVRCTKTVVTMAPPDESSY
jgi:hypothetical protein